MVTVEGFRGYAGHMADREFAAGLEVLEGWHAGCSTGAGLAGLS